MTIIERFRDDIEESISKFLQQYDVASVQRRQDVALIREILKCNNPLQVKMKLTKFIEGLSSGFISIFPFLEVNRFKASLKQVIDSPQYQENMILKSMIDEMGIHLAEDNIALTPNDKNIMLRLERLEQALEGQHQEMARLQTEVKRLKTENQFLSKTISILVEKNKELSVEKKQILEDKSQLEKDFTDLKKQVELLQNENKSLKSKILQVAHTPEKNTGPQKENDIKQIIQPALDKQPTLPCKVQATFLSTGNTSQVKDSVKLQANSLINKSLSLRT